MIKVSSTIIAEVIAGIIVLILGGYFTGLINTQAHYERKHEFAAQQYWKRLNQQIMAADHVDDRNLYAAARTIVSTRNELRDLLINLSKLLNSDIDKLAEDIAKLDPSAVRETINVLARKWPSKRDLIENVYRKLLAESQPTAPGEPVRRNNAARACHPS